MKKATVSALSDLDSMWAALDAAKAKHCGQITARPPNSFTALEYMDRSGLSETTARRQLSVLVRAGALKAHRAYVPNTLGALAPTNVYTVA